VISPEEVLGPIYDEGQEVSSTFFTLALGMIPKWNSVKQWDGPSERHKIAVMTEAISSAYKASKDLQENGYLRTALTSELVGEFIGATTLDYNKEFPNISILMIDEPQLRMIEVLKHFTYQVHIMAARLKTVEYRGKEIVKDIFGALRDDKKSLLLPSDWRTRCEAQKHDERLRLRTICDFVAGMTDRNALEFYQRIKSTSPSSIFKT
jgi:dGTPase